MHLVEPRDPAEAVHAPLRVVGHDDHALGDRHERPIGLRLEQVRRRQSAVLGDPVDAHEQHVDVERAQRVHRHRADERVGRRADAAGEDDGQVRPRLAVEDVRDLDRVGDDGEVGDVADLVGEPPRGRAGRDPDRLPGLDEPTGRLGDRLLLLELPVRLRLEAGLVGAQTLARGRAAVHLLDEPRRRKHVEVAADRHDGDVQQFRELADAHGAPAANLLEDEHLPLPCQHDGPTILNRLEQNQFGFSACSTSGLDRYLVPMPG